MKKPIGFLWGVEDLHADETLAQIDETMRNVGSPIMQTAKAVYFEQYDGNSTILSRWDLEKGEMET